MSRQVSHINSELPVAFRVADACAVLGIGRSSLYKLLAAGSIRKIRIAGRVLIPRSEIERIVAEASA